MNEATANTIVLLFAVALIVFTGLMIKRRFFNGTRHAPPPAVHNPHPHVPHTPAGPPPAGVPAPAPHPPAPAAHPAPDPHAAHAAHGSGVGQWFKDHLWMVIPWTLAVLSFIGLALFAFGNAALSVTTLFWAGAGIAVTVLMVLGTIDHIIHEGKGARYAVTFVAVLAFILVLGGIFFYAGTEIIHGTDAVTVRKGWLSALAEATKPGAKPTEETLSVFGNLGSYTLPFIALAIVMVLALWPEKEKPKSEGGHH